MYFISMNFKFKNYQYASQYLIKRSKKRLPQLILYVNKYKKSQKKKEILKNQLFYENLWYLSRMFIYILIYQSSSISYSK